MRSLSVCKTVLFHCFFALPLFFSSVNIQAQCSSGDLATSYTSNNGSRGAMFNITATNTVTIKSFDGNLYGGTTAKYEIYYKAGTYVGFETNAAAWTLAGSVNALYAAANNVPTAIPIPINVVIPAGQTYAFYVTNTASGGLNYISSAVTNVTLASDANLTMIGGVGKAYPFSSTYSYRLFNGTVHYGVGTTGESASLATGNTTTQSSQSNSGSTLYGGVYCSNLVCKVTGSGASPITGTTDAKVWIESTQPAGYVKRHYEITPSTNASTATGRVTLYYTQAEFDAFNAVNIVKLPTGPADNGGKANLLIEKKGGVSSNGTGLPNTYPGADVTLNPADADVVWNAADSRWEVSVDVSGFSGFFVKTIGTTLPVSWVELNGTIEADSKARINWQAEELDVLKFEVEKSSNGTQYLKIMEVNSKGNGKNNYSFSDPEQISNTAYYRVKQVGADGRSSYSGIVKLVNRANAVISIYPNPVKNKLTVSVGRDAVGTEVKLINKEGRLVQQFIIQQQNFTVDMSGYAGGVYLLQFSNGLVQKVVKE